MKIRFFVDWVGRIFKARRPKLTRSDLVGMYLSQANGREAKHRTFREARERRGGKFSQKRDRA